MVSPISSRPLSRQWRLNSSRSNLTTPPSGPRISLASRSIETVALEPREASSSSFSQVFGADGDRQDAVLEAVVVENIGEAGRDHAAYAEIEQRPGRMLAAGAAAEIVAGDQDLRLAVGRLVEHEVRILGAVLLVAHLGEQPGAEPGALDRLQIILGDDHVGVDIDDRQGGGNAGQLGELVHGPVLMSGIFPTSLYTKRLGNQSATLRMVP